MSPNTRCDFARINQQGRCRIYIDLGHMYCSYAKQVKRSLRWICYGTNAYNCIGAILDCHNSVYLPRCLRAEIVHIDFYISNIERVLPIVELCDGCNCTNGSMPRVV